MPGTTAAFGLGALAGSALPLGPAFVSEWLLLQALVHGLAAGGVATEVMMPIAVATVALTAGLYNVCVSNGCVTAPSTIARAPTAIRKRTFAA